MSLNITTLNTVKAPSAIWQNAAGVDGREHARTLRLFRRWISILRL